jgi:hypothetical protein
VVDVVLVVEPEVGGLGVTFVVDAEDRLAADPLAHPQASTATKRHPIPRTSGMIVQSRAGNNS